MTTERWRLKGNYFENCNCQILCPCVLPVAPGDPTDGHCDVAMAFHIDEGAFNGVSLDGLRFAFAAFTPGNMGAADWTAAYYVDERASPEQRTAIGRILSGDMGGPMGWWKSLISDFRGTTYCPISYESKGSTRSVFIPGIMDFTVEGVKAGRRRGVMRLSNTGHPVSKTLALARGIVGRFTDHGMTWDNAGKNAHYANFDWSWPTG